MKNVEPGTVGFAVIDGMVLPFQVDFVGKDVYMMSADNGKNISIPHDNFFLKEKDAEGYIMTSKMRILCRESSPAKEPIVYEVNMPCTSHAIFELHFRARYNYDLEYFFILADNLTEENKEILRVNPEVLVNANLVFPA